MHFLEWKCKIFLKISLKFVRINNIPALVQIMAWCWPGNKPSSEPMIFFYWCVYVSLSLNELRRCWCPANKRSHGISRPGIDMFLLEYSVLSTRRLENQTSWKCVLYISSNSSEIRKNAFKIISNQRKLKVNMSNIAQSKPQSPPPPPPPHPPPPPPTPPTPNPSPPRPPPIHPNYIRNVVCGMVAILFRSQCRTDSRFCA